MLTAFYILVCLGLNKKVSAFAQKLREKGFETGNFFGAVQKLLRGNIQLTNSRRHALSKQAGSHAVIIQCAFSRVFFLFAFQEYFSPVCSFDLVQ